MALFEGLGEVFAKIREEKKRPKSVKEILKNLIDDIDQYSSEILDPLFLDKDPRYKQTFKDWEYGLQNNLDKFIKEIYEESIPYNLEDEETCSGDEDNCPITKEMEEKEWKKLCKKCFEEYKKSWCNQYKRSIDIGIEYLKAYIKSSPKHNNPLRKEYIIKQTNLSEYTEKRV